ncbi:MAG: IS3 family transposase, partial [Gemmatimonas sp.]|nr:IS3 family transposase [Gemmatimonas sp.]
MRANRACYPVTLMCRLLEVSTSGYYAWLKRAPSARSVADAELLEKIRAIHDQSDGTYGSPRIHADLSAHGKRVGVNRVARLMTEAGLEGVSRRKGTRTTMRSEDTRPAP